MQLGLTQNKIYETGSQKPMLDFELASLYDVPTKLFNQTLKRNSQRFPSGGMFRLIEKKFEILRSWIVTSKRGGTSYLPCAFIERGVAMLSSVCNSRKAIEVNTAIMRTLLLIRQYAMNDKEPQKIAEAGEEVQ